MRDIINACRKNHKSKFKSLFHYSRNTIHAPFWIYRNNDPLVMQYQNQKLLFKEGRVVWCAFIQANELLFRPGQFDHPLCIVYGQGTEYDNHPEMLTEIASTLFSQKNREQYDKELKEFGRIITDEKERNFNLIIPQQYTQGIKTYYTSLMAARKHLQKKILRRKIFPLLIAPEKTQAVMMLPYYYWPRALQKISTK
jgi:hypothetical protein